jgi:hypothetical protein
MDRWICADGPIVLLAFLYGAFTSLQYTSMNTLVYADIAEKDASSASSWRLASA